MKYTKYALFLSSLMGTALIFGSGLSDAGNTIRTIKLHQASPALTTVDANSKGRSIGDILAFEAPMTGENGLSATINGYNVIMDIAGGNEKTEDRFSHIVVSFSNGSTMIVAGKSNYNPNTVEIDRALPQLRAIIGGTGEYIGARGQVSTVRNADGSYDHTIELVD